MLVMIETHDNDFSEEIAEAIKYILADTTIERWGDWLLEQIGNVLVAKRAIEGAEGSWVKNACENSTIYTDGETIRAKLKASAKSGCDVIVDRITEDFDDWRLPESRFLDYAQMTCDDNCETILLNTRTREYVLI